ncbi:MAG: hypothetical protein V1746_05370 [bacterium]
MFYLRLFDCLNRHDICYLVVGGLAVNLHGVARLTLDVDIVVDAARDQSATWEEICAELKLKPRHPISWRQMYSWEDRRRLFREKGLLALNLISEKPEEPMVDILFDPPFDFAEAFARRVIQQVEGVSIPIAAKKDLVTMKKIAGRAKDLRDVSYLEGAAE